jgi:hypothetical protein
MTDREAAMAYEGVQKAVALFDDIALHDYGQRLAPALRAKSLRQERIAHLAGVAMKREFSVPIEMGSEVRWKIDADKLARKSPEYWSLRVLRLSELLAAAESPGMVHRVYKSRVSPPKSLALRLRRESLFWGRFKRTLHRCICDDPEIRGRVEEALKDAGLGEFGGLFTAKGLLKVTAGGLVTALAGLLPLIGAMGVGAAVIVIGTLGLSALCDTARSTPRKPRATRGRPAGKKSPGRKRKR